MRRVRTGSPTASSRVTDLLPAPHGHAHWFGVTVPVRFSDLDGMGHVNNARYLSYLEEARVAWSSWLGREHGVDVMSAGAIVARIEIDYRRPIAYLPEPLEVRIGVTRVGTSSFTLGYTIGQAGECAAEATSVVVSYDYQTARSRAIPSPALAVLRGLLAAD